MGRWLLLCTCLLFVARSGASQEKQEKGVGLTLLVEKAIYARGEPISMSLHVSNRTPDILTLSFLDAQRFDFFIFLIKEGQEREVWRWSKDQLFAQVLGKETLRPGQSLVYRATFSDDLTPGHYRASGRIVAIDHPLSAILTFTVK